MNIDRKSSIAKIAAEIPDATAILDAFGVDYACAGSRSLEDAAWSAGVDPSLVLASLRGLRSVVQAVRWSERPLADVIRHLIVQHHRSVDEELAGIAVRLAEIAAVPEGVRDDFQSLRAAVTRLSQLIVPHLHAEERDVFPAIEARERGRETNHDLAEQVAQLTFEHGTISEQLRAIHEIRRRLTASDVLPATCLPVLHSLASLESHLNMYMFLENSVLFPRALAIESHTTA